jgi:hypothetical protein
MTLFLSGWNLPDFKVLDFIFRHSCLECRYFYICYKVAYEKHFIKHIKSSVCNHVHSGTKCWGKLKADRKVGWAKI